MTLPVDRKYKYLTDGQATYITDLVERRYAVDAPEREELRKQFRAIRTNADVSAMIEQLKAVPVPVRSTRVERPTEDGYYRNPETGEVWRISHGTRGDMIVSKYSLTGGPRRLLADESEIVKGKWTRLAKHASRSALSVLRKDWLIDPKTLAQDFAYGFCPLHHGPLQDAVSVALGYGPDCAEKHGLPWGEEVAKRVIAARKATRS